MLASAVPQLGQCSPNHVSFSLSPSPPPKKSLSPPSIVDNVNSAKIPRESRDVQAQYHTNKVVADVKMCDEVGVYVFNGGYMGLCRTPLAFPFQVDRGDPIRWARALS